jgi:hypothetical protein
MEGRGGGRDAVEWVMDGCVLATSPRRPTGFEIQQQLPCY